MTKNQSLWVTELRKNNTCCIPTPRSENSWKWWKINKNYLKNSKMIYCHFLPLIISYFILTMYCANYISQPIPSNRISFENRVHFHLFIDYQSMGQGQNFRKLVPVEGTAYNPYILKAVEPFFMSLHDGHLYLVAVLRYWPPKVLGMSLFMPN